MTDLLSEVIVVGAGPAGTIAAIALAQRGRDVLLLDRKRFPRDKACGDGVPSGAIGELYQYGLREKIEQAGYYPITRLSLSSPSGYVLETELDTGKEGAHSYVIPRLEFDAMLLEHARLCGVRFQQGHVQEPIMENGRVTGVRAKTKGTIKEMQAQVVVGADGVTSTIARSLRLPQERHVDHHRAIAIRAYAHSMFEHPHEVEFFLDKTVLPGYAWIFPTGDGRANIGLGMRLDKFRHKKQDLRSMLDAVLDMPAIRERFQQSELHNVATWQLNFGSQKNLRHAFEGALLVGDAAGFINPLTGGGIDNAIISAGLAAEVIDEALTKQDVSRAALKTYEQRCHQAMGQSMRWSYLIQRWLLAYPFLVDILIRTVRANIGLAKIFAAKF